MTGSEAMNGFQHSQYEDLQYGNAASRVCLTVERGGEGGKQSLCEGKKSDKNA